jgi:hypothetical protein
VIERTLPRFAEVDLVSASPEVRIHPLRTAG